MEAICSSEKSVATQQTTWRHIPEDDTFHNHRCKNLKSYIEKMDVQACGGDMNTCEILLKPGMGPQSDSPATTEQTWKGKV
jgi:hypothetical protein